MTVDSFTAAGPAGARRAPLAHRLNDLVAVSGPGLTMHEVAFETVLNLRVSPDSPLAQRLPAPGRAAPIRDDPDGTDPAARSGGRAAWQALWVGPDEWLLVGDGPTTRPSGPGPGESEPSGGTPRLVDVSANYATLLITGEHARDLLEKAITLDLHPLVFTAGCCALTTFARGNVLLWQVGEQAYRLMFRPSFGTYFCDWLIDAAQEFR